jgi:hypothetical protein
VLYVPQNFGLDTSRNGENEGEDDGAGDVGEGDK